MRELFTQNDNDTINGTISVSTIIVPKLPAMMPDNVVVYGKNAPVNNKVNTKAPPSKIKSRLGYICSSGIFSINDLKFSDEIDQFPPKENFDKNEKRF